MTEPVCIDLVALQTVIEHRFADISLLEEATTHSSAQMQAAGLRGSSRRRPVVISYERLEFLGDRVLGLVVAEMLLSRFPKESEGALARRLADLVRQETLATVANEIDLARFIRLPMIEEPAARSNPSLLADVCEAVIAALYLDGGFEVARGFVKRHWTSRMEAVLTPPKDPKTALQEWSQGKSLDLPFYTLIRTDGPPHQPVFTVAVAVAGYDPAEATGTSKRLAEANAATILLNRLKARASSAT